MLSPRSDHVVKFFILEHKARPQFKMAKEGTGEQSDELGQEAASNLPSAQGDMSDIANLKHLIGKLRIIRK